MRAGKVVAIIAGVLIVLIGLGLLLPGAVLLGVYGTQRDSAGFFETSSRALSSSGCALVTPDVDVNMGPLLGGWAPTGHRAALRIVVTSSTGTPAFVGIGPSDKVAQYLAGVDYDEVSNFGWAWKDVEYRHVDGTAAPALPSSQDFWVAEQEGAGTLTLEWDIQDGHWTAVVMNADAAAPVSASVSLGARFDILLPIGIGMTVAGVFLLAIGIVLIVLGARRSPPPTVVQAQVPPQPTGPVPPSGPAPSGSSPSVGPPPQA
jgi:uncharacterized membrane protein